MPLFYDDIYLIYIIIGIYSPRNIAISIARNKRTNDIESYKNTKHIKFNVLLDSG